MILRLSPLVLLLTVTVYWLHILQCSDSTIIPVSFTFDRDCILASHFTVQWFYLSKLIVYCDFKKNCILIVSPHFTVNHADLGCISSANLQCFSLLELQISTVLVQIWINCLSYLQWFKLQYTVFVSCLPYLQWLNLAPHCTVIVCLVSTIYSDWTWLHNIKVIVVTFLHKLQWLNLAPQYKSDCSNFSSQIPVIKPGSTI